MSALRWPARIVPAVAIFLLLLDSFGKLARLLPVVAGTERLGYPGELVAVIGFLELCCTIAYAVPQSSPVGAVLLTGYLGGAVASHLRIDDPLLTHVLAPVYMAVAIWTGLWLRNDRVRQLVGLPQRTGDGSRRAITA